MGSGFLEYDMGGIESVWDASMIIFFITPPSHRLGGYAERGALIFTYVANIFMQIMLIVSIYLGMLDRAYEDDEVTDMKVFKAQQPNMTSLICQMKSWSWEQTDYK